MAIQSKTAFDACCRLVDQLNAIAAPAQRGAAIVQRIAAHAPNFNVCEKGRWK
jgi:hypothetical protein